VSGIDYDHASTPDGMRIYAVGDIHGRDDLLERMLDLVFDEIAKDKPDDYRLVFLGDYVDRGPASAQAMERLVQLTTQDQRVVALCGNHDEGFLDFLADPERADLFVNFGGFDTAASYGARLDVSSTARLLKSHADLVASMPATHLTFLRDLPRSLELGDFFFCHAGIRPGVPLADQHPHDLIWIRREFLDHPEPHPRLVVHGHTPHDKPEVRLNRVNLDTRAFDSGRLTAMVMEKREKRFLVAASDTKS
jgi:serine/threonine protein phosphatase 1